MTDHPFTGRVFYSGGDDNMKAAVEAAMKDREFLEGPRLPPGPIDVKEEEMQHDSTKAIVVRVDGTRFYHGVSPRRRLQTAWSLAGAKLFGEWEEGQILRAELEVCKRGKKPERLVVRLEAE